MCSLVRAFVPLRFVDDVYVFIRLTTVDYVLATNKIGELNHEIRLHIRSSKLLKDIASYDMLAIHKVQGSTV